MAQCKNCKHYGRFQTTKITSFDWCKRFNRLVRQNMCCLKFEQRRYFEVTRDKEN